MGRPAKADETKGAHQIYESAYADIGCPVYPKCLECPMPVCVLDLTERSGTLGGYFHRARLYKSTSEVGDYVNFG